MAEKLQRIDLSYSRANLRHPDSAVERLKGDHLVWWYGPLRSGRPSRTIPLAIVIFRQLFNDVPGPWTPATVPLSSLPHYRTGTIWRNGKCISDTNLASPARIFEVDFNESGWSPTSRADLLKQDRANVFHHDEYPLKYRHDLSRLIDFKLDGEKNLLVPCTEYFVRAYARNTEVCRALATLRWSDVKSVFYEDEQRDEHRWLVRPSRKMRNYDAVFLAHLLYDDYTEDCIKRVNAQFTSQDPMTKIFMEATPWFRGKGQLQCRGRWINDGNTFLCLNLVGSSQPTGQEIEWQRKYFDSSEGEDGGRIVLPRPVRTAEAEEFLTEHSHAEPDNQSETVIVKMPPFKTLGEKRKVKKIKEVIKANRGRLGPRPPEANSHSSGEETGSGKNIGKLNHVADPDSDPDFKVELVTHGFLNNIWKAFQSIMAANPGRVTEVNWYAPPEFQNQGPPGTILLRPITDWTPEDKTALGWVYLDPRKEKCRGLMVLRIKIDKKDYFCFEVQPTKPHNAEYSGVLMRSHVHSPEEFEEFVREICSRVRYVVGRFIHMHRSFPPNAKIFKHHLRDAKIPYRSRLINVFMEMGVALD